MQLSCFRREDHPEVMTLVSFPMTNYYTEFFLEDQCLDEWSAPELHGFIDNTQSHEGKIFYSIRITLPFDCMHLLDNIRRCIGLKHNQECILIAKSSLDYFHFGVKREQEVDFLFPPNRHLAHGGYYRPEKTARIASSEDPESKQELKRRALRSSCEKLSHIEDPESCLLKTVLINNTLKTIQEDMRKERERVDTRLMDTEIPTKKLRRFYDPDYDRCNADKLYYGCHHFPDRNQLQTFDNQSPEQTDQQSTAPQQRVNTEHRQSSIFTELESVFHSFMCTLET